MLIFSSDCITSNEFFYSIVWLIKFYYVWIFLSIYLTSEHLLKIFKPKKTVLNPKLRKSIDAIEKNILKSEIFG